MEHPQSERGDDVDEDAEVERNASVQDLFVSVCDECGALPSESLKSEASKIYI